MKHNQLITTLDTLEKQFKVLFEVKPTPLVTREENVIHFTTGDNVATYGSRTPAVWLTSETFFFFSAVNGDKVYKYESDAFPRGDWISVQISQIKSLSNYIYTITINGNVVHNVTNNDPAEFRNVKIFAGNSVG